MAEIGDAQIGAETPRQPRHQMRLGGAHLDRVTDLGDIKLVRAQGFLRDLVGRISGRRSNLGRAARHPAADAADEEGEGRDRSRDRAPFAP